MTNIKKTNIRGNSNVPIRKTKITKEKIHKSVNTGTFSHKKILHNSNMEIELTNTLSTLLQMDFDAAEIYKNILENIKNGENIYYELNSLRNDHLRHIDNLTKYIPNYIAKEFETKGSIWSEYIELLGNTMSIDSFLKVLLSSEKKIYQFYSGLENIDKLDKNLKQILFDNFEDEKSHIKYIEEQLNKLGVHNK